MTHLQWSRDSQRKFVSSEFHFFWVLIEKDDRYFMSLHVNIRCIAILGLDCMILLGLWIKNLCWNILATLIIYMHIFYMNSVETNRSVIKETSHFMSVKAQLIKKVSLFILVVSLPNIKRDTFYTSYILNWYKKSLLL